MLKTARQSCDIPIYPDWLPEEIRHYLIHTECGVSIRKLARNAGCHASTILRQIRKTEARRDDPLVDEALAHLGAFATKSVETEKKSIKDGQLMNVQLRNIDIAPDTTSIDREARRILRRLSEPGACLAVAAEMDKAVVVRETADGRTIRTAVTDRSFVQTMVLKGWISSAGQSRISRYQITSSGRNSLKLLLQEDETSRANERYDGGAFGDKSSNWAKNDFASGCQEKSQRIRYNLAESPVAAMARSKDKKGEPFLSRELVTAAERLREDFELAQMEPQLTQNWESFLLKNEAVDASGDKNCTGQPYAAKQRVSKALSDLGPGLADVALRVCCFLEGLEAAEKRMGWSARSGKVVLRIALQRLKHHYDGLGKSALIG